MLKLTWHTARLTDGALWMASMVARRSSGSMA